MKVSHHWKEYHDPVCISLGVVQLLFHTLNGFLCSAIALTVDWDGSCVLYHMLDTSCLHELDTHCSRATFH